MGVADGVGGWIESNIDPAIFARCLCDNMAQITATCSTKLSVEYEYPRKLLELGYKAVMEDSDVIGGGSTACVAAAREDGNVIFAK